MGSCYIDASPVCKEFSNLKKQKRDLKFGFSLLEKAIEIIKYVLTKNKALKYTIENPGTYVDDIKFWYQVLFFLFKSCFFVSSCSVFVSSSWLDINSCFLRSIASFGIKSYFFDIKFFIFDIKFQVTTKVTNIVI